MQLANYKIVFKGEISSGYELEKVKQEVMVLFKLAANQVEQIFSGVEVTLKKDITYTEALQYQDQLKSLGLIVYLKEESIAPNVTANEQEYSKSMSAENTVSPVREAVYRQNEDIKPYRNIEPPAIWSFDFSGRYGRLNFANGLLVLFLVFIGIFAFFILVVGVLAFGGEATADISVSSFIMLGFILYCMVSIVLTVFGIRIAILRLHDFNMTGWLCVLYFVPFVSMIFILVLLIVPGASGENQYGPPVRQGSILGLVAWVLIILLSTGLFTSLMLMYQ